MDDEEKRRLMDEEFNQVLDKTVTTLFNQDNPITLVSNVLACARLQSMLSLDGVSESDDIPARIQARLKAVMEDPRLVMQLVLTSKIGSMALLREINSRGGIEKVVGINPNELKNAKDDPAFRAFAKQMKEQLDNEVKNAEAAAGVTGADSTSDAQSWLNKFMSKHKRG